jgi:hypothetical protein
MRMCRGKDITVMHIPETGHTPLLADRNHIGYIREWLQGQGPEGRSWSALYAPVREAFPGNPIPFAPLSALR